MASLKQRGGTYYAQFYDKDGKQCRIATGIKVIPDSGSTPARNKKLAQEIAVILERKAKGLMTGEAAKAYLIAAAKVDSSAVLTVQAYMTSYRPSGKEQNQANAKRAVKLFLDFLTESKLDGIALDEVKRKTCEAFLGAMLQHVTVGTVGNYRAHLTKAFNRAVQSELITRNPFEGILMPEIVNQYAPERKGKDKTERAPFTAEELRRILTEFPQPYNDLAAVSLFTGGQRIGDCIALTWAQVGFQQGLIHFNTQKTAKRLTLPLLPELRRRLEARRDKAADKGSPLVFPELERMAARCKGAISTRFTCLLRDFGILEEAPAEDKQGNRRAVAKKSFHSLRHASVTLMREGGVPADVSRAVVGHESEAVERAYFTASTDARKNALSVIAEAVKTPPPPEA